MKSSQGLGDIVPQVFNVLNSNAQSNKARYNACSNADIVWNKHVTGIERALDQRFNAAEAGRFVDDIEAAHEFQGRFITAFNDECYHA